MSDLTVGSVAPNFSLPSIDGSASEEKIFTLKELKGSWVVLYFYPKDDTPGCTKEACNFRDKIADYQKVGAVIYGISVDNLAAHAKFIQKYRLPFPLLSDTEKQVVAQYGVWQEKSMFGKKYLGIDRTTFIIDPQGKIAKVFKKVKVEDHHQEVLDFIKKHSAT